MSEVRVRENETLDSALRRFKRQCAMSGIMSEVRKREHYDKPSVRRKKKAEAARQELHCDVHHLHADRHPSLLKVSSHQGNVIQNSKAIIPQLKINLQKIKETVIIP